MTLDMPCDEFISCLYPRDKWISVWGTALWWMCGPVLSRAEGVWQTAARRLPTVSGLPVSPAEHGFGTDSVIDSVVLKADRFSADPAPLVTAAEPGAFCYFYFFTNVLTETHCWKYWRYRELFVLLSFSVFATYLFGRTNITRCSFESAFTWIWTVVKNTGVWARPLGPTLKALLPIKWRWLNTNKRQLWF